MPPVHLGLIVKEQEAKGRLVDLFKCFLSKTMCATHSDMKVVVVVVVVAVMAVAQNPSLHKSTGMRKHGAKASKGTELASLDS